MSQQAAETPRVESFTDLFRSMTANIEQVIKGKRDVVQLTLLALLAEGHVLLEDAPGVGKTTIGKALAATLDVPFGRVQFTPDLLPSDVVGVSIWNRSSNEFEHAGTYPLPESQLDRFLVKVSVGYPGREAELEILESHGAVDLLENVQAITDTRKVQSMIRAVKSVHVSPALQGYLVDIVDATRRHPALTLGASPRAALALQRMARARAAAAGRNFATPDDVKALAPHVLAHRLMLNHDAELRGVTAAEIIDEILQVIPAGAA